MIPKISNLYKWLLLTSACFIFPNSSYAGVTEYEKWLVDQQFKESYKDWKYEKLTEGYAHIAATYAVEQSPEFGDAKVALEISCDKDEKQLEAHLHFDGHQSWYKGKTSYHKKDIALKVNNNAAQLAKNTTIVISSMLSSVNLINSEWNAEIVRSMLPGSVISVSFQLKGKEVFAKFSLSGMTKATRKLRETCGIESKSQRIIASKGEEKIAGEREGGGWENKEGGYNLYISAITDKADNKEEFSLLKLASYFVDKASMIRLNIREQKECRLSVYIGISAFKELSIMTSEAFRSSNVLVLNINGTNVRFALKGNNALGTGFFEAVSQAGKEFVLNKLFSDGVITVYIQSVNNENERQYKFINHRFKEAVDYHTDTCKKNLAMKKNAL